MFLLAAYSIDDLSEINIPVLSITAANDNVLDMGKFHENTSNLPEGLKVDSISEIPNGGTIGKTIYYDIPGGNHGQFGNSGNQEGDGTATIDIATQHALVISMLNTFLDNNNL
jgi:hypothetical protein